MPFTKNRIKWNNFEGLKILGVLFFNDFKQTQVENWERILTKIEIGY